MRDPRGSHRSSASVYPSGWGSDGEVKVIASNGHLRWPTRTKAQPATLTTRKLTQAERRRFKKTGRTFPA